MMGFRGIISATTNSILYGSTPYDFTAPRYIYLSLTENIYERAGAGVAAFSTSAAVGRDLIGKILTAATATTTPIQATAQNGLLVPGGQRVYSSTTSNNALTRLRFAVLNEAGLPLDFSHVNISFSLLLTVCD